MVVTVKPGAGRGGGVWWGGDVAGGDVDVRGAGVEKTGQERAAAGAGGRGHDQMPVGVPCGGRAVRRMHGKDVVHGSRLCGDACACA